jgi:subtilisin-like proprotein convertase family protein
LKGYSVRAAFAAALVLIVTPGEVLVRIRLQAQAPQRPLAEMGNFDIRVGAARAQAGDLATRLGRAVSAPDQPRAQAASALAALRASVPGAEVTTSPLTEAAEVVRNPGGALTGPAPGRPGIDIVREFLTARTALYGLAPADIASLRFLGESVSRRSGLRMVRVEQVVNGLRVFQTDTRFILDRDGRIVRSVGLLVPADGTQAAPSPRISSAAALADAMESVGNPAIREAASSELVYFPLLPGLLVAAWMHVTFTDGAGDYTTLVDAESGTLLWRKNIRSNASAEQARFSVYVQDDGRTPAHSPAPHAPTLVLPGSGTQAGEIARTTVGMLSVQDMMASPNGWIADGGNTTTGNNVDAYLDTLTPNGPDIGLLDFNGRPIGNVDAFARKRDFLGTGFDFTPAPSSGNPDAGTAPSDTQFRRGAVTQLFYVSNWYHDEMYGYGFDEAAGNFQFDNFGRGGLGGDPVRAEAQDFSGTNNATFSTPPDGFPSRMQMYVFSGPALDRDASLDSEVVLHELTHGLSNRLIGNGNGLLWDVGGGMGEGWSDFYALALLNGTNAHDPDARYVSSGYSTYRLGGPAVGPGAYMDNYLYGIRRFPYSTDNTVNPLTWADADDITFDLTGGILPSPLFGFLNRGAFEVHNVGEIWALTLWEVRSRIINDPAGANGDVPTGNATMLQLVTDALKMTPINPSLIEARDALVDADCVTNACANERSIWGGFADRGLGHGAVAPLAQAGFIDKGGHLGVGESFDIPRLERAAVIIDDGLGNDNGGIDLGELVRLTVTLRNPWRRAAEGVAWATARLISSTPGVTVTTADASYGPIAPTATSIGTPFVFRVDGPVVCGQSLRFTVQTTSALGTTSFPLVLRVGAPAGSGAPVTYTKGIAGGLAIPDNNLGGVMSVLAIADDLQIADLDFRVDSLTHTWTGDLTVGLRGPEGNGTDLIWRRGEFVGEGDGDNFVNTVIDDSAVADLNQSPASAAPFTGSWKPAFNGQMWGTFGNPHLGPDPVGQLSRFNGTSTQGAWTVVLTDQISGDTGKLNSWSLIVTPAAFSCAAFVNQPPTFSAGPNQFVPEDSGAQTVVNWAGNVTAGASEAGQAVAFSLTGNSNPALFSILPSVDAAGTLRYTPAPNANGTATIALRLRDNGGTANGGDDLSEAETFTIAVLAVNDPPSFTRGTDQTVAEDAGARTVPNWATDISPGPPDEAGQSLAFSVTAITNAGLFSTAPAISVNGTLTYTPAADASGIADVTFVLQDDGGTANGGAGASGPQSFRISVVASPDLTSIYPTGGRVGGGTTLSVRVSDFALGVPVVTIGGVACANVQVSSDALLTCVTGPAPAALPGGSAAATGPLDAVVTVNGTRATLPAAFTYVGPPPSPTTDTDRDGIPDAFELRYSLDPLVAGDASRDPDGDGLSNAQEFQQESHPRGLFTRYFAEGATTSFFDDRVALANAGVTLSEVVLRFLKADGTIVKHAVTLNALSRATVDPETLPGLASAEFSTVIESDRAVVADRTMTWGANGYGSHAETSVDAPALTWFLAEGATHSGFNLFFLIQNPGSAAAEVQVTYLLPAPAAPIVKSYWVEAVSRFNIWVNQEGGGLASSDVSAIVQATNGVPIIVERAMYLDTQGQSFGAGHESAGVTGTATNWFLAEGATGPFFDLFILIANPGAADAAITATYLLPDGSILSRDYVVAGNSRFNIWVDFEDAALADTAVSTTISSTNGVGIIVERSMWWSGDPPEWREAHNSPASTVTGTRWAMAEGEVGGPGGVETYILIANTSPAAGSADVTLLFDDGTTVTRSFALAGSSRFNVAVAEEFPSAAGRRFGAIVQSSGMTPPQIVVERAMYSNAGGVVWAAGTNALATRLE